MAYSLQNQTPSLNSISWSGVHLVFDGVDYSISDGSSDQKYLYWVKASPTTLQASNIYPSLGAEDCLVFLNTSGIGLSILDSEVVNGNLVVPGTVQATAIAAGAIRAEHLSAGAITASAIDAYAITAEKIGVDQIEARHIVADAITARAIAASAITSEKIEASAVIAGKIAASAVDAINITASAITAEKVAASAISAINLVASAIQAGHLAAGAVTAGTVAASSIGATELAASAVVAGKIGASAIAAVNIQASAITAGKIDAHAVTATEIAGSTITAAEMAASSIQAINIQASAVTAGKIAASAVTATEIAASAVVAGKIAASAVDAVNITASAITAGKIAASAVGATELIASAVTAGKIAASAVGATEIQASAVVAGKIAASAVTATEIAASAVVAGKIAASAVDAINITASAITAGKLGASAVQAGNIAASAIQAGNISAGAVTAGTVAASAIGATELAASAVIAGKVAASAIDAAAIQASAVTAGKIAAAAVTAVEIASSSILASKLAIGAIGAALNQDPTFSDITAWFADHRLTTRLSTASDLSVVTVNGLSGTRALDFNDPSGIYSRELYSAPIEIDEAKTYRLSAVVKQVSGAGINYLLAAFKNSAGASVTGGTGWTGLGTWNYWVHSGTVFPANFTRVEFTFGPKGTGSTPAGAKTVQIGALPLYIAGAGEVQIQDLRIEEVLPSVLIQDGAIAASKIAASAVTAGKIDANAVTATEIAASAIIAGKIAASAIDAINIKSSVITASQIAADTITGTQIAGSTITAAEMAASSIGAINIIASAITAGKIAASAVTALEIASSSIIADKIAGSSITADKLVASTLTAREIAADAITTVQIAASAVTALEIAGSAITAEKIAVGAITADKLAAGSVTASAIDAYAITADHLGVDSIEARHITAEAVEARSIAASAITAEKIEASAITAGKIAASAISTINLMASAITADKVAANAIGVNQLVVGTRRAPSKGLLLHHSFEGFPDIPDNTGGITYRNTIGWTGGVEGYTSDSPRTVTVSNSRLDVYKPASVNNDNVYTRKSASYVGKYVRVRFRADFDVEAVAYEKNDSMQPKYMDLARFGQDYVADVYVDTQRTGTFVLWFWKTGLGATAAHVYIEDICIGDGTYSSVSEDNSGEGYSAALTAVFPVVGPAGRGLGIGGRGWGVITPYPKPTVALTWSIWGYSADWLNATGTLLSCTESGGANIAISSSTLSASLWVAGAYRIPSYVITAALTAGWHKFSLVFDGANTILRVDGREVSRVSQAGAITWTMNKLFIGGENNADAATPLNSFSGYVDELRIYDWALPEAEDVFLTENPGGALAGMVVADQIVSSSITAGKIAASAVTAGKIAASAVVAGNIAASAIQAINIVASSITGTQIAADTITGSNIMASSITASDMAASSINAINLVASAVTAGKIAASAVTATEIAASAVVAGKIAASAVTATEIAASSIIAGKIAASAVGATELIASAVIAGKIAASAIGATEIRASAIIAGKIAASAVTATEIAASAVIAGKVAASAITAVTIATSVITADKMIMGNFSNEVANGSFDADTVANGVFPTGWGGSSVGNIVSVSGSVPQGLNKAYQLVGSGAIKDTYETSNRIRVEPGEQYEAECWYYRNSAVGDQYGLGALCYDVAGTIIAYLAGSPCTVVSTWTKVTTVLTIPANGAFIIPWVSIRANTVNGSVHYWTGLTMRKRQGAELIVDGAIIAGKIAASAIAASNIMASAITAGKVAASAIGAVEIAASAVVAGKIGASAVTATEIAASAVIAGKIAASAVTAATVAASAITAEKLTIHQGSKSINVDTAFEDSSVWIADSGTIALGTDTTAPDGVNVAYNSSAIAYLEDKNFYPIDITKRYRVRFWAKKSAGADGILYMCLRQYQNNTGTTCATNGGRSPYKPGGVTPSTSWQEYSNEWGPGDWQANVKFVRLDWLLNYSGTTGNVYIHSIRFEEMIPGELVVDGAITALKIATSTIVAGNIAGSAITAEKIQVGAIQALHLAAGAVTADAIDAYAINAFHIGVDVIEANHISADAITARAIAASAITAEKIEASAITAGKIAASAISAVNIVSSSILAYNIAASAITADKIAARAVLANHLSVLAANFVNDPTVSGNIRGWAGLLEDGSGSPTRTVYDGTEKALKTTNSGDYSIRSASFPIDHTKIYKIAFRVKKDQAVGLVYVGPIALATPFEGMEGASGEFWNSSDSFYPITESTRALGGLTAPGSCYFCSALAGSTSWSELYECYLVGALADETTYPEVTLGNSFKLQASSLYAGIRIPNWSNGGTTTSLFIKNVSVSELDGGTIVAANIKASAIVAGKLAAGAVSAGVIAASAIYGSSLVASVIVGSHISASSIVASTMIVNGTIVGDNIKANSIHAGSALIASSIVASVLLAQSSIIQGNLAASSIDAINIKAGAILADKIAVSSITGSTMILPGSVDTGRITASAITASLVAASAISAINIQANAISSIHMQASAIVASNIQANAIQAAHLQANVIAASNIQASAIVASNIQANAISSIHIQANAIVASNIQSSAITGDRINASSLVAQSAFIANLQSTALLFDKYTASATRQGTPSTYDQRAYVGRDPDNVAGTDIGLVLEEYDGSAWYEHVAFKKASGSLTMALGKIQGVLEIGKTIILPAGDYWYRESVGVANNLLRCRTIVPYPNHFNRDAIFGVCGEGGTLRFKTFFPQGSSSWEARTHGFGTGAIRGMANNGPVTIVVGDSGRIERSQWPGNYDFTTLTTPFTTQALTCIEFDPRSSTWVIGANDGSYAVSTNNGDSWTRYTNSGLSTISFITLGYPRHVFCDGLATSTVRFCDTAFANWGTASLSYSGQITYGTWGQGRHIIQVDLPALAGIRMLYSTSGTSFLATGMAYRDNFYTAGITRVNNKWLWLTYYQYSTQYWLMTAASCSQDLLQDMSSNRTFLSGPGVAFRPTWLSGGSKGGAIACGAGGIVAITEESDMTLGGLYGP